MSDRHLTSAINKALRGRFAAPEWAAFFEVTQSTGFNGGRSADCVAMNLFPSRGLRVHGVEIKASRSDWMRELRNPTKAEAIQCFCDHWWIAAPPEIVLPGELPPTWGLLELKGGVLRQKTAAPRLKPQPMSRAFIASMFRRADQHASACLREAVDARTETERAAMNERIERRVAERTSRLAGLEKAIADFEAASGVKIEQYGDMRGLGEAVRLLRQMGIGGAYGSVARIAASARKFAETVEKLLPSSVAEAAE